MSKDSDYTELEAYRAQVRQHIESLQAILAKGAIGEFWDPVDIPDKPDEFTELYVGIELMLEVIREKYAEIEGLKTIPPNTRDLWNNPKS